jgi:hypothetical protein
MILIVKPSGRRNGSSSQITAPWSVTSLASRSATAVLLSGTATVTGAKSSAMTGRPSSSCPPSWGRSAAPGTQRADERGQCLLRPGSCRGWAAPSGRPAPRGRSSRRPGDPCMHALPAEPGSPVPRRDLRHTLPSSATGCALQWPVCAPSVTLVPDSPRVQSRYARVPLCQPSQTSTLRNGHRSADGRDGSPGRAATLMAFHPTRTWCCRPASYRKGANQEPKELASACMKLGRPRYVAAAFSMRLAALRTPSRCRIVAAASASRSRSPESLSSR